MTETETPGVPGEDEQAGGSTALHHRLRQLILDGVYPPGARLPERDLAQALGVSRTPLREVLRMLQREGLVEAGRYQRARVAPLEPVRLDMLYAGRIQLETLGLALTIPCLREEDFAELDAALSSMCAATTVEEWEGPHRRFHQLLVSQAGEQLRATIASYADQSQRYRLILAYREIHAQSVSAVEHGRILQACRERNREEAVQQYARHLARTALTVLAHMAPEYEPVAVRTALALVHMGSGSPAQVPPQSRHTDREKKKDLTRMSL
ncbi:MAG TPA: GntR family transcriptional regulator [Ktedonobacteraceae bacterium]|jgi:DNA-binding GntR family transcriptional regulator|nr:GntR family transcriptional regulator [Ktedonobacteraceae bacterium]